MQENRYVGVDFDGTCVIHEFPKVGADVPGAVKTLKKLVANGHNLILFTMRSNIVNPESEDPQIITESGDYLAQAVNWFKDREIHLFGIQTNPTQYTWTTSPKAYCHIYIDDASICCPLIKNPTGRDYVNWAKIDIALQAKRYY